MRNAIFHDTWKLCFTSYNVDYGTDTIVVLSIVEPIRGTTFKSFLVKLEVVAAKEGFTIISVAADVRCSMFLGDNYRDDDRYKTNNLGLAR